MNNYNSIMKSFNPLLFGASHLSGEFASLLKSASQNVNFQDGMRAYDIYNRLEEKNHSLPRLISSLTQGIINDCRDKCLKYPDLLEVPSIMNPQKGVAQILFIYLDEKIRALAKDRIQDPSKDFNDLPLSTRENEDIIAFYDLKKPLDNYLSTVDDPNIGVHDIENACTGEVSSVFKAKIDQRAYQIETFKINAQYRFLEDLKEKVKETENKRTLTFKKNIDSDKRVVKTYTKRYEVSDSASLVRVYINRMEHTTSMKDTFEKVSKAFTRLSSIHRGKRVRNPWITKDYKKGKDEKLTVEDIALANAKKNHTVSKQKQDDCQKLFDSAKQGVESAHRLNNETLEKLASLKIMQKRVSHFILSILTFGFIALYRHFKLLDLERDLKNNSETIVLSSNFLDENEKKLREIGLEVEKTHAIILEKYKTLKASKENI